MNWQKRMFIDGPEGINEGLAIMGQPGWLIVGDAVIPPNLPTMQTKALLALKKEPRRWSELAHETKLAHRTFDELVTAGLAIRSKDSHGHTLFALAP